MAGVDTGLRFELPPLSPFVVVAFRPQVGCNRRNEYSPRGRKLYSTCCGGDAPLFAVVVVRGCIRWGSVRLLKQLWPRRGSKSYGTSTEYREHRQESRGHQGVLLREGCHCLATRENAAPESAEILINRWFLRPPKRLQHFFTADPSQGPVRLSERRATHLPFALDMTFHCFRPRTIADSCRASVHHHIVEGRGFGKKIRPMPMFAASLSPSPHHTTGAFLSSDWRPNVSFPQKDGGFLYQVCSHSMDCRHVHYVSEPFGRLSLVGSMLTASVVLPRVLLCTSRNSLAAELYL